MKTRFRTRLGVLALGFLSISMAQGATSLFYVDRVKVTDLGTLGGVEANALDINNRGVIVGYSKDTTMTRRAFRWSGGVMTDLGTPTFSARAIAQGINDRDEIVGFYGDPDEFNYQAFYWSAGTGVVTLNRSLYPSEPFDSSYIATAKAINNQGVIVGKIEASGTDHDVPFEPCYRSLPVRWTSKIAMPQILHCTDSGDGPNGASDINGAGWAVGYEYNGSDPDNGFLWKSGVTTHIPSPLFGNQPRGAGINEAGMTVGSASFFGSTPIAMRWSGSGASEWLGTLSGGSRSGASEVNDQGFVSGTSEMLISGSTVKDRAFLWHPDFGMFALPLPAGMTPTSTTCDGNALNNRVATSGIIEVVGRCGSRAIRWTVTVLTH